MNTCIKCNSEVQSNYCPNCGHPQKVERINGRYILSEVTNVLNFQKGILYTTKELLIRPGHNIRTFISEDRNRLVKPIVFILVTSLFYTLFLRIFNFEDAYINYSGTPESTSFTIFKWIQGNYGYSNMIMAVFIALWLKLLFRKYAFNFFEILILLCFVMGIGMLIYAVFGITQGLTGIHFMQIAAIVGFIYTTFALGQFFEQGKAMSYVKAFCAYILGMLSFSIAAVVIGILIDLIK
jgi:hypothetical protein